MSKNDFKAEMTFLSKRRGDPKSQKKWGAEDQNQNKNVSRNLLMFPNPNGLTIVAMLVFTQYSGSWFVVSYLWMCAAWWLWLWLVPPSVLASTRSGRCCPPASGP